MSEGAEGHPVTPAADVYSIATMLYQMLAGSVPFDSDVALDLMMMHVNDPVEPPRKRRPDLRISDSLELLVLRMLEKDPARRLPSMREVEQALEIEIDQILIARGQRPAGPAWYGAC